MILSKLQIRQRGTIQRQTKRELGAKYRKIYIDTIFWLLRVKILKGEN